jgi:hypothetical protein
MTKLFALLSVVGVMMLGAPQLAYAVDHDRDDRDDHHGAAPEPLTVIGLALGAGAIGVARLVSKRKPKSP